MGFRSLALKSAGVGCWKSCRYYRSPPLSAFESGNKSLPAAMSLLCPPLPRLNTMPAGKWKMFQGAISFFLRLDSEDGIGAERQ